MSGQDNAIEAEALLRGRPRFSSTGHKEARTMVTTTTDRAEVFSRPAARFDDDGNLEVRASASLGCRRALWYSATGYQPTNPPSEDSLTAMEAGNALEPVVVRAMERAGWQVAPADPQDPQTVTVRIGPNLLVTGHPDGTARMPLDGTKRPRNSSCSTTSRRLPPSATRWWWRSRRGDRTRSSVGGRWGPSAATRRRWPRPPSTRWEPAATFGMP